MRELVGLTRRDQEGDCPTTRIGDHDCLGAKAAARAPKRLTFSSASASPPLLAAPAVLACGLMFVPWRKAIPSSTPRFSAMSSRRSYPPSFAQRMKVCAAFHHDPRATGTARHFAPFVPRQMIASTVRLRSEGGTLAIGTASLDQGLQNRPLSVRQHRHDPPPFMPV